MSTIKHSELSGKSVHHPYRWIVANSNSITSVSSKDLYKKAFFTDSNTEATLVSVNPITFTEAGGGGDVESVNGQTGIVTLDSGDITETTNLYYTDTRARSSLSVSGDLSYDSTTGVVSFNETYSTPAEVKSAYESNVDTNAFTDALQTKLNGIEAGAEVNAATNLGSSGTGASRTITSSTGSNTTITYSASDVGLGNVRNVASYSQTESDGRYVNDTGDSLTGTYTVNTTDDGVNKVQVSGGTRTDTLSAGSVQTAQESIDTDGNVQVRGEGQMKMGDFAMQYNAATKSLDFNFIGA